MQIPKIAAVLMTTAGLLGCGGETAPRESSEARPNVLLISIDTLRADHLGCYGYSRSTSPAIDALRADSVLFESTIAQAPSTLHSHASILTSLLPFHHQASSDARTRLPDEAVTVTESLRAAGYATAAFTGGGQMDRVFGLDQGFDSYSKAGGQSFLETARRAIGWLEERKKDDSPPFFLFLHTYETHHPYSPSPEYLELFKDPAYRGPLDDVIEVDLLREINQEKLEIDDADLAHIISTYDAEIRSMDDGFLHLSTYLRDNGLYEDTLIVFTSDHGEEFGEHGRVGWHSHTLFDELLRVPLIIKFPRGRLAGATVETQTRSIDIAPTILAATALERPDQFAGIDLASLLVDKPGRGELVAISRMDRRPGRDISSIRTSQWKLYRGQLFDLQQDPQEAWDTATNHLAEVDELTARLEQAIESRQRLEVSQVAPTGKTLDELKALGYLQ